MLLSKFLVSLAYVFIILEKIKRKHYVSVKVRDSGNIGGWAITENKCDDV